MGIEGLTVRLTNGGINVLRLHYKSDPKKRPDGELYPVLLKGYPKGKDDPRYLIRVKGDHAESSVNTLVSYTKAYAAYSPDLGLFEDRDLVLACDAAREGDDLTTILLREKCLRDDCLWTYEDEKEEKYDEWADVRDSDNGDDNIVRDGGDISDTNIAKMEGLSKGNGGGGSFEKEAGDDREKGESGTDGGSIEFKEEVAALIVKKIPKHKTMEAVSEIILLVKEYHPRIKEIAIDVIGVGAGVYDRLFELRETHEIDDLDDIALYAVNVAESAGNKANFVNLRAELAHIVKEELEGELLLYNDEDIVDQVSQLKYKYPKGRFILEPKEDFKRRYKRSYDELDALFISYAPRVIRERQPEARMRWI